MSSMEAHKGKAYPLGLTVPEFLAVNPQLVDGCYVDEVHTDPYEVFYNVLFYNGGCSLQEAIQLAIKECDE